MRTLIALALVGGSLLAACDGGEEAVEPGTFVLPGEAAERYDTAYIAELVADPPGDDLAEGGGEHVVIANNATIRIDMGGWWLEVGDERLPLGIGRQIDVDAELRVHPGPGETGEDAVFLGLDQEVLHDDAGTVVLKDAAGTEVARFDYPEG
ncbi:MAG: lamin tail domain-containing protein [Acidimicrobiia bacterium]